ncbi:MAG TPA: magnesium transporter [Flavobacteriaceae bacterium]|nr:magnesium transporter [Flavobacteriaceae bacterium]MCB9212167.1 magnesium transporter [Alteromonas sp.]HPF10455.1 magnesium transporter [Flavobacteriaceae bacterium]HQU21764.1 magnesium transporter [Flavobacteriaceae bacterium]HQU64666.1 magnesium transporter [Flavobacteriaceae bacterium]
MAFQLTEQFLEQIEQFIAQRDGNAIKELLHELHFADVAEILEELDSDEATYLINILESEITSEALMEVDEDVREKILERLSPKEIARELAEMDTDDAADVVSELDEHIQRKVIDKLEDEEHAAGIVELLKYDEDTAGGLMAKELVKVKDTWTTAGCVREMRRQAKNVTRVHSIYVVDKEGKLKGRLSLKDLLTAPERAHISDIYIPKVDFVNVHTEGEDVARIMQKYDLEAIPVVDDDGILVGRVTIDDIVDFIRDEAEKDYQMAAGISGDVEADDSIIKLTKARLPWLLIGVLGGLGAASIIEQFSGSMGDFFILLSFVPLIQATAGNVGVQSSAIVVQGLANDSLDGSIIKRLLKESLLGLVNGLAIAILALGVSHFIFKTPYVVSITIGLALIVVIIIAALIGTFIPIFLDKRGIDPAVATGPFITTSNDVFGILIYFLIAKLILGF